ncbi:MAG: methionyl-tRNA formyltransferase [Betaproteobacteria bacterium]|nr:methionyl-tRNA formyltransferase [Betaproteobacteria bacterium]
MRIVFAGTPHFAAVSLAALHDRGHDVAAVLTQPQRPAGRGMKPQPSAVALEAERRTIPVLTPATLKEAAIQSQMRDLHAELFVVAAYGLLLPQAVLDIPARGCLNIHGSLLPRWRGAAPVQRAIEAGDTETGICIMQMDAGLDTGPVLLERRLAIAADETSASLFEKLTTLGAATIVDAIDRLGELAAVPQAETGATYARKIMKKEAPIDWTQAADVIERRIRAFDPFPGCESTLNGVPLKIWRAEIAAAPPGNAPGGVIGTDEAGILVQAGLGALRLRTIQLQGGKRLSARDFVRGHPVTAGSRFQ